MARRRRDVVLHQLEALERRRLFSAGDLDPGFGAGGRLVEPLDQFTFGSQMLVLRDDRLLTERHLFGEVATQHQYELRRYNPDGTPDTTFGNAGVVVGSLGPEADWLAGQLLEQPDGKILAVAQSGSSLQALVRFNPDGTLDSTFDGNGVRRVSGLQRFSAFDVDAAGRIFLANYLGEVFRLLPDGTLDATFAGPGSDSFTLGTMKVAPDGKILLGGTDSQGAADREQLVVMRLNADGSPDATFGHGGTVVAPVLGLPRSSERADKFALLPSGQILVGCFVSTWDAPNRVTGGAVLRLDEDGTVDSSFNGASGVAFFPGMGTVRELELDGQGRAIVTGTSGALATRLLADGTVDPAFGRVVAEIPWLQIVSAELQSNGRLIVHLFQDFYVPRLNGYRFVGHGLLTFGILTDDPGPSPITLDTGTGVLSISGTAGDDVIDVIERGTLINAVREGFGRAFEVADVERVSITAGAGDDRVWMNVRSVPGEAYGGDGSDRLSGGERGDTLYGQGGRDFIDGGFGADLIIGGGGNDQIRGQAGADHLYGYAGNEYIEGNAGDDRIVGGDGDDTLSGGAGNDRLIASDGFIDRLFGDAGDDAADADEDDLLAGIETIM